MLHRLSFFIRLSLNHLPGAYLRNLGLSCWSSRRQLRALRNLDDHLLADIGLTRRDVHLAAILPPQADDLPTESLRKRRLAECR